MTEYIKEKKIINVNSNDATIFRNSSFLSDLTFSFPNIVSKDDDIEYLEGGLESAVFPVSFYIVNYSNNVFSYTIEHLGVYTNYSITIPVGNYDYKSLFQVMTDLFLANTHKFVLTLNEINGIMTLEYHPTSGRVFYRINHSLSTCFRLLGFDYNTDYFPTLNILTAPFALNLLGIKKLKIYCPQFSTSNLDTNNYATTTLISTILNDQPPWGQINYYDNTGDAGSRLKVFELNTIDIRITDEYGAQVNFNNCDWSMTFVLRIFRKLQQKSITKLTLNEETIFEEENVGESTEEQPQENIEENEPQEFEDENVTDLDFLIRNNPNYFD